MTRNSFDNSLAVVGQTCIVFSALKSTHWCCVHYVPQTCASEPGDKAPAPLALGRLEGRGLATSTTLTPSPTPAGVSTSFGTQFCWQVLVGLLWRHWATAWSSLVFDFIPS
jgi:hypothetical protein